MNTRYTIYVECNAIGGLLYTDFRIDKDSSKEEISRIVNKCLEVEKKYSSEGGSTKIYMVKYTRHEFDKVTRKNKSALNKYIKQNIEL